MNKKLRNDTTKIELIVYNILKTLNRSIKPYEKIDKYTVDFLIDDKYIIECYGDYWHCNPNKYPKTYFNRGKKKSAEEIWNHDNERQLFLENCGYKFLSLWETDINNGSKKIRRQIKRFIEHERHKLK